MDSKKVCLRILRAESEGEVDEVVSSVSELSDGNNWRPIDRRETNFNVVTNQASTGGKALTELCTNMVDAVLMKYAHKKGIDPRGSEAPRSVIEAVRVLVRLPGVRTGILAEADSQTHLKDFSEKNLVIGVTGGKGRTIREDPLCFTFADNGEGQNPCDFEDTFLSLSTGNKSDIPFVQGKYNMGSSGVLSYCGDRWYKLILSRRHDEGGEWGWTLVRRRPGLGTPIAEYFFPNNDILAFSESAVRPMRMQNGEEDDKVNLVTGTIVKLYDYQMGGNVSFRGIRESLNENLVSTILPFRLMDYRVSPSRTGRRALGIDERGFNGMEFLLLRKGEEKSESDSGDEADEPGTKKGIGIVTRQELGRISVWAIVLGRKIPSWLNSSNARVFHAVNGQVQFKQNRAYLSRSCKLPGLKDRIVVIVDASDLHESGHNDVWKGDREAIRETRIGQLYKDAITDVIAGSQFLKNLQQKIAREEIESATKERQETLLQEWAKNDPSIAQLLPGGSVVKLPGEQVPGSEEGIWEGQYSPTFLNLLSQRIRREGAEIAVDGRRRVLFKTDAVNDWFIRPENQGTLYFEGLGERFSHKHELHDGLLTLTFMASHDQVSIGEEIDLILKLKDDAMAKPVTAQLKLWVVAERSPRKQRKRPKRKTTQINPTDADSEETTEGRGWPPYKWLTKDGRSIGKEETDRWPAGFTEQDGGEIGDLGDEGKVYRINYDNAHFQSCILAREEIDKKVATERYRIGMQTLMMGLEDAYFRMENNQAKEKMAEHIDEIRRLAAQGSATVVMSIMRLSTIVNPASVADPDDD